MASVNNIVRSVNRRSLFPSAKAALSSSVSFDQGDLMYLDTSTHLIKKLAIAADSVTLLGVSPVKIVSGKLASPISGTAVDAAAAASDVEGPVYGVVAKLTLNTGDTFQFGDAVYNVAGDAQKVSVTGAMGSVKIGYYVGPSGITAAAGDKGEIHVGAQIDGKLCL